ncbi:DNA topoisomerase 2-associated protein pat1 [Lecanora helva]
MSSQSFHRPTATDFRHPSHSLGFGTALDPFAGFTQNQGTGYDDDDAIDFEDTYDGLGNELDEADDDFNDDTFGGEQTKQPVGKDFDFYGSTSKVTDAINEEAVRLNRRQPASKAPFAQSGAPKQPKEAFKTGYEAYKNPAHIPELQVDRSLWNTGSPAPARHNETQRAGGSQFREQQSQSSAGAPTKVMMSLEEVEAAMQAQSKGVGRKPQHQVQASREVQDQPRLDSYDRMKQPGIEATMRADRASQAQNQAPRPAPSQEGNLVGGMAIAPRNPQIMQRGQVPTYPVINSQETQQPRVILQNPNRHSGQFASMQSEPQTMMPMQPQGAVPNMNGAPQMPIPVIYHPSQIMNLPEEERKAYLAEEAKRAKRNHKIFLLSKGNGLMTPQDKNFITRIQLQQLMTATGNVNEQDPDASLSEDFYYQVYNQIENRPRQYPQQPLSNFAQTYLFRTGGRQGIMGRRQRGGDSHMQRMEQQVQRAVEAAKAKPKNKQLVIEGSLGKISFSNSKTPKPLLNIKRHDSSDVANRSSSRKAPQAALSTSDHKTILRNIEDVYQTLMKMEDHDRRSPSILNDEANPASDPAIEDWQQTFQNLNQRLWMDLRVTEPIMPDSTVLHPFIAFLSYPKGKKAIPRIFNHIDDNQRLTILTMIMVHLDVLDVIRLARPQSTAAQPSLAVREQIDIFLQTVMPSLFSSVTDAPLNIIVGLLSLVVERTNMNAITHTRVGLEVLTMLLSRAAIIKAIDGVDDQTWDQWLGVYNHFFDLVEPFLGDIFPSSVNAGQDQYVWQFLAATGSGANSEQQQRLVIAVKDRVMDTVQQSKTLPPDMASQRRSNVNLFMQAIGLDVDLLDG